MSEPQIGPSAAASVTPLPKKKAQQTRYVVLALKEPGTWNELGAGEGANAKAVVAKMVAEKKLTEGTFVAVPVRSFDPITVKTETQTKIKFS